MCYFPQNIFIDVVMISAAYVHGKTFFSWIIFIFFFKLMHMYLKNYFHRFNKLVRIKSPSIFIFQTGCINTTSFSYTNRRFWYQVPYDIYESVVFSFCELGCTNDARCTYFTYINTTHRCQLYDRSFNNSYWNYSCSDCLSGTKIAPCETEIQESVGI